MACEWGGSEKRGGRMDLDVTEGPKELDLQACWVALTSMEMKGLQE